MSRRTIDCRCKHYNCTGRATYALPVSCSNCGAHGQGTFTHGHEASVSVCPDCGTRQLRAKRP